MDVGEKIGELELSEVEKLTSVVRRSMAGPNSVRPEGEYFVAVEPNSFGLPSVDTCPGSTDYCESDCYAIESERRTATHDKLQRNLEVLQALETVDEMTAKIHTLVEDYEVQANKLGVPKDSQRFRIHWSGDFFSVDYALAWRKVIEQKPDLKFFTYTRSFQPEVNVLPALSGLENLALFISVDRQNVDEAEEVLKDFPDTRVAYLVDYREEADELIDQLDRKLDKEQFSRILACPENMRDDSGKRKLPVINKYGGACSRCTYCVNRPNNWDVVFVKTGYEHRPQRVLFFASEVQVEITPKRKESRDITQPVGNLAVTESFF